ncbi:MAG: inositol monophosphatase family protein [Microvirgula sp.]
MQAVDQVIHLLREIAQTEVMPRFLRVSATRKHDGTPFTEADLATQDALARALPDIIPAPVLGEEMSPCEQAALWDKAGDAGIWVVDPIDGTTNFIHGLPYFAISVAWMVNGRSELGVIYNPVADEMFYAERGSGAYLNGVRLPLKPSPEHFTDTIAAVEIKYLKSGRLSNRLLATAPFGSLRNLGSSTLDWCNLASGRYDLYLHGGQRLWDYAAGALILEEAGGRSATIESDDYWSSQLWHRTAIAALDPRFFEPWKHWIRLNQ